MVNPINPTIPPSVSTSPKPLSPQAASTVVADRAASGASTNTVAAPISTQESAFSSQAPSRLGQNTFDAQYIASQRSDGNKPALPGLVRTIGGALQRLIQAPQAAANPAPTASAQAASSASAQAASSAFAQAAPSAAATASANATSEAPKDGVQRPAVRWTGGVQHNGNNPEVVVQQGRSYSSRPLAAEGVGFQGGPQRVFSSSKNLTGSPMEQSLVLSNPGNTPMQLKVSMQVTDPKNIKPTDQTITVPPGGSVRVPVASANDKGFIAFDARVEPLNDAAKQGKIHVDVVAHSPKTKESAAQLASKPLMPTEGERGFRIPASRLFDHPAYVKEARFVMAAAGQKDALDTTKWSDKQVRDWVTQQTNLAKSGQPNQFDPAVNRGILGRVNGLVPATAGEVQGAPLDIGAAGSQSTVRIRPNADPPALTATRPGGSDKDVGAYGKRITTTIPLVNSSDKPIKMAVRLATPPHGQDGAQIPGHQSYNGPIVISATNGQLSDVKYHAQLGQPGGNSSYQRDAQIAVVTVPPGQTIQLRVGLDTHANSQFPLDLSVMRQ